MADREKEELVVEKFGVKYEIPSIQEYIIPSSTVEDTCTEYAKEGILPSSTVEDTCTVHV